MLAMGVLVALSIRFPEETSRWKATQDEIRKLQEENADLRKLRDEKEERLKTFNEDHEELELEIRRQYHLHKEGDTIYMLPPGPRDTDGSARPAPGTSTTPGTP